jgi:hypothetical protein
MHKFREITNDSNYDGKLYVTSLPVRGLHNFRPLDFCWNEGTKLFYVDDIIIILIIVIYKITNVTPNNVPCACVPGNPPNMMVVH